MTFPQFWWLIVSTSISAAISATIWGVLGYSILNHLKKEKEITCEQCLNYKNKDEK
jgi:membrane protein DedA with SNARE-associated domain